MSSTKKKGHTLSLLDSLKEISGTRNKFIIYNLVTRNLKLRYRKSILGIFWTMLIPGMTAVVYYFVFQFVMRVSMPNYLFYLLLGLIPWTFISISISHGLESIVGNHSILNKVPLPIFIFPMSEVITAFLNLIFSIPVLLVVGLIMKVDVSVYWLTFPFYLLALFLSSYFISLILGVLYVYFRDLRHIVSILMQIWFYGTPIIYDVAMVPQKYKFLLYLNPVGMIFHGLHEAIINGALLPQFDFLILVSWLLILCLSSVWIYKENKSFLIERI